MSFKQIKLRVHADDRTKNVKINSESHSTVNDIKHKIKHKFDISYYFSLQMKDEVELDDSDIEDLQIFFYLMNDNISVLFHTINEHIDLIEHKHQI